MSTYQTIMSTLPIILVSAKSEAAANHFISELIDNEPPASAAEEGAGAGGRVWRIDNKYYTADVRVLPLADGAPPPDPAGVHGHVIYLEEDECSEAVAERRAAAAAGAAARGVRVLAAQAARLAPALAAWCARARREPVALREAGGAGAARAALHAHVWPGLARRRAPAAAHWDAAAWGAALGGVRALPPDERRAAAEGLVAALCRALGDDL